MARNSKKGQTLSDIEKFCLDAYIFNSENLHLAYRLSRKVEVTATDNLHRLALRWLRTPDVKEYIENRRILLQEKAAKPDDPDRPKNRGKDDIVAELNILANATKDPKQKTEILMKLADLQQMKKDKTQDEEDTTVHFYLPISCYQCPLFLASKKKGEGRVTTP